MSKRNGNGQENLYVLVVFAATYGNEVISVGDHEKNTDVRNCPRLSKHCTKPTLEDEMCLKEDKK